MHPVYVLLYQSKKDDKAQESIQSITTTYPGYQWESTKLTIDITNESQEVSPFPAGDYKASINRRTRKHSAQPQSDAFLYQYFVNGSSDTENSVKTLLLFQRSAKGLF